MRSRIFLLGLLLVGGTLPVSAQRTAAQYEAEADSLLDRAVPFVFVQLDSLHNLTLQAVRAAERGGDSFLLAESYEFLGNYYSELAMVDSIAYYLDRAHRLYRQDTGRYSQYYALSTLAEAERARGNDTESLRLSLALIEECERIGDRPCLADAYWQIGGAFYYQDLHQEAVAYSRRALELMEGMDDSLTYASSLIMQSESLRRLERLDESRSILLAARDLLVGQYAPLLFGELYMQAGANHLISGDLDLAEASLQRALRFSTQAGARLTQGFIHGYIGRVYLQRGEYGRAIRELRQGLMPSIQLTDRSFLTEQQRYLGEAYAAVGALDSAYHYSQLAERNYRNYVQEDYERQLAALQLNFETEEQQQQIEQQQQLLRRQRQQLYGVAGVAALLLTLGLGLFALSRRLRRKNEENVKLVADKETLIGEIHHRVKNNLQVISSLLQLQIRGLPAHDVQSREALLESQARVEAMGLIHQRLYQEGSDFTQVHMADYLQELGTTLLDAYQLYRRVELDFDVVDTTLDVDVAIPLGLIVNELITNSLKHAFPNEASGTIYVSLYRSEHHMVLQVRDDGVGLSPAARKYQELSFGTHLITLLSKKLRGEVRTLTANSYGTEIRFPHFTEEATH